MTLAIPEELLRQPLPSMPEWFPEKLANLAKYGEKPLFRIVDGLRETEYKRGKHVLKHLLQESDRPVAVNVHKERYRRKNTESGEHQMYPSWDAAEKDTNPHLSPEIERAEIVKRELVGRACWIVEVYIKPEEICEKTWNALRFELLEKNKIMQEVDVLGPYPSEGMYRACFDVISEVGEAVSPSDRTLEECKRRMALQSGDTRTVAQSVQCSEEAAKVFEEKQRQRLNDGFFQFAGITAKRLDGGVISRPLASAARR